MGGFAVHSNAKGIVCLWFDQGSQKRDSPILQITFDSELDAWSYTVHMIQERFLMGLLLDDPSVIHKLYQNLGGERQT